MAKQILLASHMAAEHIRYHDQPLPWRPQGWSEFDNVSQDGLEVERIGRWPHAERALRDDREIKAIFAANSERATGDKIGGCFSKAKYGQRNTAGKPRGVDLTKREIDDACGRFDRGKRMNAVGYVAKNGGHIKKTLHGGGYGNDGRDGDAAAFERSQKPNNKKVAKLFARNQASPHASARERRTSEDHVKMANWIRPTGAIGEGDDKGVKGRPGGRSRPFSADDSRNITVNSQKIRYVVEGIGYGGTSKSPETPWPGQRNTHGACDPAARLVCQLESSAHFANNLYKDRFTPRPF